MNSRDFIDCLKLVIATICIQSGQVRNCIGQGTAKKYSEAFCRRICSPYMTPPDDRVMKCGIIILEAIYITHLRNNVMKQSAAVLQ